MKNNSYCLKKESNHYFQIQGQMHILNRKNCYFLIYSLKWKYLEIIQYNKTFWETKMEKPLIL